MTLKNSITFCLFPYQSNTKSEMISTFGLGCDSATERSGYRKNRFYSQRPLGLFMCSGLVDWLRMIEDMLVIWKFFEVKYFSLDTNNFKASGLCVVSTILCLSICLSIYHQAHLKIPSRVIEITNNQDQNTLKEEIFMARNSCEICFL